MLAVRLRPRVISISFSFSSLYVYLILIVIVVISRPRRLTVTGGVTVPAGFRVVDVKVEQESHLVDLVHLAQIDVERRRGKRLHAVLHHVLGVAHAALDLPLGLTSFTLLATAFTAAPVSVQHLEGVLELTSHSAPRVARSLPRPRGAALPPTS